MLMGAGLTLRLSAYVHHMNPQGGIGMTREEDLAIRAGAFTEDMLRFGSFPCLEMLVAAMVLYLRARPITSEQQAVECHALFRKAHDRYLAERRERMYGKPLEELVLQ